MRFAALPQQDAPSAMPVKTRCGDTPWRPPPPLSRTRRWFGVRSLSLVAAARRPDRTRRAEGLEPTIEPCGRNPTTMPKHGRAFIRMASECTYLHALSQLNALTCTFLNTQLRIHVTRAG